MYKRISRTAWLVLLAALVPVGLRLAVLPWTGVPQPAVHDEFSYLLAADTFASGRLANPTHPLWEHFEGPHVLQEPTYASKYFPGQGLILALGQSVSGHPWAGVLVGMGLAIGATAWMLRGWLPWRWAVLGVVLLWVVCSPAHHWWNSYWGGGLPAAGGALILGALPRMLRRPSVGFAFAGALGLGVLLLTRPNSALWLGLPVAAVLAFHARRGRRLGGAWPRGVFVAGALTLVPILVFTGVYNRAVTGNPFELPYMLYERSWGAWPLFKWERPRPVPVRNHEVYKQLDQWWREYCERSKGPRGIARQARMIIGIPTRSGDLRLKNAQLEQSAFGVLLLLSLPWAFRDRRMRVPLLLAGLAFINLNLIVIYFEHYGAPWIGLRVLLIARAAERANAWWRKKRWPRPSRRWPPATIATAAACAVLLAAAIYQAASSSLPVDEQRRITVDRPAIIAELARHPGRHVVLVRYGADHDFHQHWVYNAADIDAAPIVWAWEMGPERDRELFEYYEGRSFWLLEPDAHPARLTPLPQ